MRRRARPSARRRVPASAASVALAATGVLGLPACTVGPDYERPTTETPETWAALGTDGAPLAPGERPDADWWAALGDEELSWLVRSAVASNLRLEIATARVREARALVGVAEGALRPQLGSAAAYERLRLSEHFPVLDDFIERGRIDEDQSLFSAGFDASWEIDLFGGRRRTVESTVAALEARIAERHDVLLSVVAETARNYFALRGAQARLSALESNIASQHATVEAARDRRDAGLGTDADVLRATSALETLQARLPSERSTAVAATLRLSVLTATDGPTLWNRLADAEATPEPPLVVPVGLPGELLRRRPDVRAAERSVQAASAAIGVAVAELYPSFSLTGRAGLAAADFADLFSSGSVAWSIGPGLRWPIFQGGRIRATIELEEARHERALLRYQRVVRGAIADVETSLTRYALARVAHERLAAAVSTQRDAVRLARRAYESGLSDIDPLLDAQGALASLEVRAATTRESVLGALASLNKSLGGGWPVRTDDRSVRERGRAGRGRPHPPSPVTSPGRPAASGSSRTASARGRA